MIIKNLTKLTQKQQTNLINDENISKSQKMKDLFNAGLTVKQISELLNVRYNFVYNVISNYIITNDIEIIKEEKVNKKQIIINLHLQNKSNKEISIETKTNYNYVYKIIKEYKSSQPENVINK